MYTKKKDPLGGQELTGKKYSLCEKRAVMGTYGPKHKRLTPCATRTIIFQRENLNYFMV